MQFEDFETTIEAGGRPIPVRITGAALHGVWGADSGPQTAQGLFDANRPLFDEVIADKLQAGDVQHGVVVVTDADLDF
jgi:hypothetical protein